MGSVAFLAPGPSELTVAGFNFLAYAVLQSLNQRAQCFARVCLAGPVTFLERTPLNAARVRVPLGPRFLKITFGYQEPKPSLASGALVQLKLNRIAGVGGISCAWACSFFWNERSFTERVCLATLAQLVEQQTENLRVWSSILRGGKIVQIAIYHFILNCFTA